MENLRLIIAFIGLLNLQTNTFAAYSITGTTSCCPNLSGSCTSDIGPTYTYSFTGYISSSTYNSTTKETTTISETIKWADWGIEGGTICSYSNTNNNSASVVVIWDNDYCSLNLSHKIKLISYTIERTTVITDNNSQTPDVVTYTNINSPVVSSSSSVLSLTITVPKIGEISNSNTWTTNPYKYQVQTITYSIYPVCDATSYSWTIPAGWTCTTPLSGQNLTSITVTTDMTASGSVKVIASQSGTCALSKTYSKAITRQLQPISDIKGLNAICTYKSVKYSVVNNPYLTYNWTIPTGWFISGQGSNTVYITAPSASYVGGGVISVQGTDGIDYTGTQQKEIAIGVPTLTYTRTTVANIIGVYFMNHPIGSNLFKSTNNTTWQTSSDIFNVQYPETISWYIKATNECGTSPILHIHMRGTYCPSCPL